jgi:WD40 repeat protein
LQPVVSKLGSSYQVGGSLPSNASTYVRRRADQELYLGLQAGEFCYVLNSRQMGKSSLRVQTMQRLQSEGFACSAIDITKIGSQNITPEQWYASMIGALAQGFQLTDQFDLRTWWRDRELLSPVQRLADFIEGVLLVTIHQRMVIFVDEIDSVLSLNFPMDDFFALIRAHYNNRADQPDVARISFVLLGVAAPSSLIQDKQRTPFNIGRAIPLEGFQSSEAQPLSLGLVGQASDPLAVIQEVLFWSGGQPFLSQKICRLIQASEVLIPSGTEKAFVANLVRSQVIEQWELQDEPEHLKTIRNRLLANQQRAGRLLGLYQSILHQGQITADDSPEQMELRLTGLVNRRGGQLQAFNPIYGAIFNADWVERELANLRPYTEAFQSWWASRGSDASRLLRGQALQDALIWASNKSLGEQDYQFLTASQEQDKQAVEQTLVQERQAKQAAEEVNQILTQAQTKAVKILRRAFAGLGIISLISVLAIAILVRTNKALETSRQSLSLEQDGVATLEQFPKQEILSLLLALQAGRSLQSLVNQVPLSDYPTTRPMLVLQTILDRIHEKNFWQTDQDAIFAGSFSANGQQLITAGEDGSLKFWHQDGTLQRQFIANPKGIKILRLSPDGKILATVSRTDQIQLWNLEGIPLVLLWQPQAQLNSIRFSGDGRYLAAASDKGQIYLWNLAQANSAIPFSQFPSGQGVINSLGFTVKGDRLLSAGQDGTVRIWNLSGEVEATWQANRAQPSAVKSISINPQPSATHGAVATVGEDGILRLWSLDAHQLNQWRVSQTPAYSLSFSPDGSQLLTLGEDGTARLWDLSGQLLMDLKGHEGFITSANWSPDNQQLMTTGRDGTVRLWNLQNHSSRRWTGNQGGIWSVDFHPQGQLLATAGKDSTLRIWNRNGQLQQQIQTGTKGLNSLGFSPDGQRLAASGQDGRVRIWDRAGQLQVNFAADSGQVFVTQFNPNGRYLATAGEDGTVRLWNSSGQAVVAIPGHQGPVWSLSFSPNGQQLASTGKDGAIYLWNLKGQKLLSLHPQLGWLTSISFTPDGESFITAGQDGIVRRWNLAGQEMSQFRSHTSGILNLGLSPDGQRLATSGQDGRVKVWSLAGQQVAEFSNHQGAVYGLAFSPAKTGQPVLVTVGQDDTIQLQQLGTLAQLLQRGCSWLADYLTLHPANAKLCS